MQPKRRMLHRGFWRSRIEAAWKRRSIVWLSGVRRAGKTVLCQSLPDIEYLDCELPRVRARLEDGEAFLRAVGARRVVLDEIHRLPNPSELLKIAADHFPRVRIVATGSSTLQASSRFRDTLTGRKVDVWLTPMMTTDLSDFRSTDSLQRLRHGGLPPFFLAEDPSESEYQEWMHSYWARDVQELFRIERRASFLRLAELVLARSGGIFEATAFARPCEVSRTTIANYLAVLEVTRLAHVVRPFSKRRTNEIVAAPKVYGFDTGFVCIQRGWDRLRPEDLGQLWEHYVLNELHARAPHLEVRYWRDTRGHEVDFVIARPGHQPLAIECKWSSRGIDDLAGLQAFRRAHPRGENWIVAADVETPFERRCGAIDVRVVNLAALASLGEAARSKK